MQTISEHSNDSASLGKSDHHDGDDRYRVPIMASGSGSRPASQPRRYSISKYGDAKAIVVDRVYTESAEAYGITEVYPRRIVFGGSTLRQSGSRGISGSGMKTSRYMASPESPRELSRRVVTNETTKVVSHQERVSPHKYEQQSSGSKVIVQKGEFSSNNEYREIATKTVDRRKLYTSSMIMSPQNSKQGNGSPSLLINPPKSTSEPLSPNPKPTMTSSTVYYPSPSPSSPKGTSSRRPPASISSVKVEKRMLDINFSYDDKNIGKSLIHGQEYQEDPKLKPFTPKVTKHTKDKDTSEIITSNPTKDKPIQPPVEISSSSPQKQNENLASGKQAPVSLDNKESILESDRCTGIKEIKETLIHDPYSYFSNYNTFSYRADDDFSKIDADRDNKHVYLTGRRGIARLDMDGRRLSQSAFKIDRGCVASKCVANGNIITQDVDSGSIMVLDRDLDVKFKTETSSTTPAASKIGLCS